MTYMGQLVAQMDKQFPNWWHQFATKQQLISMLDGTREETRVELEQYKLLWANNGHQFIQAAIHAGIVKPV